MDNSLLLMAIGPVQGFIASARRLQDLWYGSVLLSDLAHAVASEAQENEAAMVLPGTIDKGARPGEEGVANKILVSLTEGQDPSVVAQRCEARLRHTLQERAEIVLRPFNDDDAVDTERARRQLDELIEFHWVSLPAGRGFREQLDDAEAWLSGIKRTRQWVQGDADGAGVPKASADPGRESVLREKAYEMPEIKRRQKYRVKGAERLSGVGLLKRFTPEAEPEQFFGGSHLAASGELMHLARFAPSQVEQHLRPYLTILSEILGKDGLAPWRVRREAVGGANGSLAKPDRRPLPGLPWHGATLDAGLLYPNRINDILPNDEQHGRRATASETLRKARQEAAAALTAARGALGLPAQGPGNHFVIMMADGDSMGARINKMNQAAELSGFSDRLNEAFTKRCADLIRAHAGSLVYAGGDDVFAVLPTYAAFDCADALRKLFSEAVPAGHDQGPGTLSVGLAIVHHMDPLAESLNRARRAEAYAKTGGKDRLAVLFKPRGGSERRWSAPWNEDPSGSIMNQWVEEMGRGTLSVGTARHLTTLARQLGDAQAVGDEHFQSLIDKTIERRAPEGVTLHDQTKKALHNRLKGDRVQACLDLGVELELAHLLHGALKAAGLRKEEA